MVGKDTEEITRNTISNNQHERYALIIVYIILKSTGTPEKTILFAPIQVVRLKIQSNSNDFQI